MLRETYDEISFSDNPVSVEFLKGFRGQVQVILRGVRLGGEGGGMRIERHCKRGVC